MHIQQSPKLLRRKHPDYYDALSQTVIWVIKKIEGFKPESPPPTNSEEFIWWVNGYLAWRINDLYRPDMEYLPKRFKPVRLNEATENGNEKSESIADPKGLTALDDLIREQQQNRQQRIGQQIRDYIEQDPQGILTSCHPRKHPECNAQVLTIRVQLNEPPQTIRAIAVELGIPEQTIYTHWRTKCQPRLRLIALRFDELLRQAVIEPEAKDRLSQCHLQERPECNCWNLAELLLLTDPAVEISTIAQNIQISKESDIWNHWDKHCLPILKRFRS